MPPPTQPLERTVSLLLSRVQDVEGELAALRRMPAISRLGSFGTAGAPNIATDIMTGESNPRVWISGADGGVIVGMLAGETYDPRNNLTGSYRYRFRPGTIQVRTGDSILSGIDAADFATTRGDIRFETDRIDFNVSNDTPTANQAIDVTGGNEALRFLANEQAGDPAYVDQKTKIYVLNSGGVRQIKFRRKDGATEEQWVLPVGTPALDPHGAAQHTDITRVMHIPYTLLNVLGGSETVTVIDSGTATVKGALDFDPATVERAGTTIGFPTDFSSGVDVTRLYWCQLGAGTGDVLWRLTLKDDGAGEAYDGVGTSTSLVAYAASGTQFQEQVTALTGGTIAVTGGSRTLAVTVNRIANSAADTYAADAGAILVELDYTANQ